MAPSTTSTLPSSQTSKARTTGPRASVLHSQARSKRSGGPQDRALYRCGCGYVFRASVSTTVGCPHCGTTQAW